MDLAAATGLLLTLLSASPEPPRRFGLILGNNLGGPSDQPLRYAHEDARRVSAVLRELGQLSAGDAVVLVGASAPELAQALAGLEARLQREARSTDQLFVYVSSHAQEGELLLSGTRFPIAELTAFVRRAPVGVALLILDSCRSGAITRLKGLKPKASTVIQVEADDVRGRAFISSSGANEYAQESDSLGGSYFTHHLVAGLRGAADQSADGRVTLHEAYAYAYARTIASTVGTLGGIQHPSFHLDLLGHGDLILTAPAHSSSRLTLETSAPGRWTAVSADTGTVYGEIEKSAASLTLALPAGRYRLQGRTLSEVFEVVFRSRD